MIQSDIPAWTGPLPSTQKQASLQETLEKRDFIKMRKLVYDIQVR